MKKRLINEIVLVSVVLMASVAACDKPSPEHEQPSQEEEKTSISKDVSVQATLPLDASSLSAWKSQQFVLAKWVVSTEKTSLFYSSDVEMMSVGSSASLRFKSVSGDTKEQSAFCVIAPKIAAGSASGSKVFLNLPPEQKPLSSAPDPSATLLVGFAGSKTTGVPESLTVDMTAACAFGKMTVSGVDLAEGEKVISALIQSDGKAMTGSMSVDMAASKVDFSSEVSSSSVRLLAGNVEASSESFDLWFCCKPFSLSAGEKLTVQITTTTKSYVAEYAPSSAVEFRQGGTTAFAVTASSSGDPGTDPGTGGGTITPDPGYTVTGTVWYVSPEGNDNNSGTSPLDPLKTFAKVLPRLRPGDQVRIMPGTYEAPVWGYVIDLTKENSGTAGHYISFVAHDPANKPVFHGGGKGVWGTVNINASYVVFDGIEMVGDCAKTNLDEAYAFARKYYETGSCDWGVAALYNTNGITVGGTGTKSSLPHHVIVRNCIVHDMPGGGICAMQADYITFEYNTIYNCSWYTMYAASGISYLNPVHIDDYTGYKMIVRGNKVFNCRTEVPWVRVGNSFSYSDGNGIIIDINNTPDSGGIAKNQGAYKGRTLVVNNISVNNGGSGIHSYKANHVDMVGNTAYHNGHMYKDNSYGEIWSNQCSDVHIYNNIMYARPGGYCNLGGGTYTNNIYYGGTVKIKGTGDNFADPMFVKLSTEITEADFHLTAGSPAIGYGATDMSYLPTFDHDFHSREARFDCGAYQYVENK